MLRLTPCPPLRTLELASGNLLIDVGPTDFVVYQAARTKAQAEMKKIDDGLPVLDELGYSSADSDLLADIHIRIGLAELIYAVALGEMIIKSWTGPRDEKGKRSPGPVDETGSPLPVNRQTIIAVMKIYGHDFIYGETANREALIAEGNGSTPSPGTSLPDKGVTAKAAKPKTSPAHKESPAKTANSAPS